MRGGLPLCAPDHTVSMPPVIAARTRVRHSGVKDGRDGGTRMKRLAGTIALLLTFSLLAASQGEAATLAEAVRNVAESVLGHGVVTSLRTDGATSTVLMRWRSATYKAGNKLPTTRELLYTETVLATSAIMGQLPEVRRIRFTVLLGDRMLATGETSRARGLQLVFAPALGGGIYKAPASTSKPYLPGGDSVKPQ